MINNRDSINDWSITQKETIELPYRIGTILELKESPAVLAAVYQYLINDEGIKVGLHYAIDMDEYERDENNVFEMPRKFKYIEVLKDVACELTIEELQKKWRKSDVVRIGKIEPNKESKNKRRSKVDEYKEAVESYIKWLDNLAKVDPELAKTMAKKSLIETGVLNEDGSKKEHIVDYPPHIGFYEKPKQKTKKK